LAKYNNHQLFLQKESLLKSKSEIVDIIREEKKHIEQLTDIINQMKKEELLLKVLHSIERMLLSER
jgi:hypothetical protein